MPNTSTVWPFDILQLIKLHPVPAVLWVSARLNGVYMPNAFVTRGTCCSACLFPEQLEKGENKIITGGAASPATNCGLFVSMRQSLLLQFLFCRVPR